MEMAMTRLAIVDFMTSEELFDSIGPAYETAFAHLQPQLESIEWIMRQIQDRKPAEILDLWCGTSTPVQYFVKGL
jgi:hypothetical protein